MKDIEKRGLDTKLIHAGQHIDPATGAVATPIYQSSTFAFRDADHGAACFRGEPGYKYTRLGNPTTEALEKNIAILEGGCGGLAAATGMAAVNMVYLTFLGMNTHIVATESLYGPSRMILENEYPRFGVSSSFVDSTDPANVEAAMTPETKLVYVETPANPTLKMTDIAACAEIAHKHGALLCVDNTFASPYLQNPLQQGADIVLHSMTKFINGHTDVVAGMVVAKESEVLAQLRKVHYNFGGTMDPHQAWLVLRGVKSLGLRMDRAQENAMKLAAFLEQHPKVTWIRYPGLESHPQYALGKKQMRGPRRRHELRRQGRPGSGQDPDQQRRGARPGRQPGWHREPHRTSGQHDPRGHPRRGAPEGRHQRRPGAHRRGLRELRRSGE